MGIQSHHNLEVWRIAIDLVDNVYELTLLFPKEERYGLASQMQRCAVSIPSNIAEGSARHSTREFMQFISIARGSLAELETQLIIAQRRGYGTKACFEKLFQRSLSIAKMLTKLRQS